MKKRLTFLALVLASALLSASCSKVSTSAGPGGVNKWTKPGVLLITDISDPSTLNPMLSGSDIAYQLASFTLEYLVQLDDSGNVVPVLCERVPSIENGDISKDGLAITYHLRKGVTWSDGQPFTSEDIVASWKQVMNPNNNVQIREGYDVVDRIDTPDKHTAVLHLKRSYAALPTRFFAAIQEGPIAVMPAHIISKLYPDLNKAAFNSQPIGTGPFIVKSWVRNGALTFAANPRYWRGKPKIRQIVFRAEPDATALVGFRTHELDANFDASTNFIPQFRELSGMNTVVTHSLRLTVSVLFTQGVLHDVRLRRAIVFALDRHAILEKLAHGAGYVADEYLPTWSWGYTSDVPKYPYDPKRSGELLAGAGWQLSSDGWRYKGGKRLEIVLVGVANSLNSHNFNTLVQSYLRAVGIRAIIKEYSYSIVFDISGPVRQGHFDMASYSYSVNYDPSSLDDDGCDQFSPAGGNDARLCDPVVDRLERQGLATYDQVKRKKIYAEIERRRMEDVQDVIYYFRDRVGVMNVDLHNYRPSRGITPNWNAWQWSLP
jgi:peptide/nickel transport system substrate-binding protein